MQNSDLTISDVLHDERKNLGNVYDIDSRQTDEAGETLTQLVNCQYYTLPELTTYFREKVISDSKHLKLVSLNIANLLSKLNSLKQLINTLSNESNKPNIISITETHLSDIRNQGYSDSELTNLLPGYKFFHNDRKTKRGGGVGVFVQENLAENAKISYEYFAEEIFEGITLTLPNFRFKSCDKNLVLLTVYRQPGDSNLTDFQSMLSNWLELHVKRHNEVIVTGDLNLDLLKYDLHSGTSDYLDLMITHCLLPTITRPTRIKHQSATLIDHIFTRIPCVESGILVTELAGSHGFTDHYPTFCIIEKNLEVPKEKERVTRKIFTTGGHKQRQEGLKSEDWTDLYTEHDPNKAFEIFQNKYCKHYNSTITSRTFTTSSNNHPRQPWMTAKILRKIKKRDRIAKLGHRKEDYRQLRNEIVADCRKAEKTFWSTKIQENFNNIKEHWNILRKVMGQVNDKTGIPTEFKVNGSWITDKLRNAELMNTFFSKVGPDTNVSVGTSTQTPEYFLNKNMPKNQSSIPEVNFSKDDIIDACKNINAKKSFDAYGLTQAVVLSDVAIIAPMLTHVANCSIKAGVCPELTKIARVIPVYKNKGDKHSYTNYRPISLLPVFSKILERLMYNKVFHFLVRQSILFKSQYGFRKGHSTTHATLDFLKTIESALEDGQAAVGVFCDLSKAFDTLDHKILLKKLDHYGIRGGCLSWFSSYLSNRKQYVDINGFCSGLEDITVGVPQGSVLGPLLFLLYINDLPASLDKLSPILFADDTNLVIKGKKIEEMVLTLNSELSVLSDFFKANKLKLNAGKTKIVCFRKKGTFEHFRDFSVSLDGSCLEWNKSATFLGITLDEHLSWEEQCNKVGNKMAQGAGVLNRVKNLLPTSSLCTLYNSFIFSHFSYGLEVWGACRPKFLKRLVGIQKKSIRSISKSHWLAHTEPKLKKFNILKIPEQHKLQCLNLMYDTLKGHCPDVYNLTPNLNQNKPSHALRSTAARPDNLRLPSHNSSKIKTSFLAQTPDNWNNLSDDLKQSVSRKKFKKDLKTIFLRDYKEKIQCHNPQCVDRRSHPSSS